MLCRLNKRLLRAACLLSELVVIDLRFDVSQGLFVQEVRRVREWKERRKNRWEEKSSDVLCVATQKKIFLLLLPMVCCFILIWEGWNTISVYCLNGSLLLELLKTWDIRYAQAWCMFLCVWQNIESRSHREPPPWSFFLSFPSLFLSQDGHKLMCV